MKRNTDKPIGSISRRQILATGGLGAAGAVLSGGIALEAQESTATADLRIAGNGNYAVMPLRKDALRVTAVQSQIRAIRNTRNPDPEMKANLDHVLELIDMANGFPGPQDLVCFHEQPIMGWNPWSLQEALRVAIEVPGPETDALGKKAMEHGCYITFGTYARDIDWPGHLLLNGVLISPEGKVVANHWKTNNGRGFRPNWDLYTTSIYDVLDRYREMYGEDAVLPLARTDIGNISCSITPGQPDVIRALAIKGLELRLSSSSGGYNLDEAKVISQHNRLWTVVCNQSVSPEQPGFPAFSGSGDTAIFAPSGSIAAQARSVEEEFVTTTIPVAEFRRSRTLPPGIPIEMLLPVYSGYVPRHGPNLQADYVPTDFSDASRHFAERRNW